MSSCVIVFILILSEYAFTGNAYVVSSSQSTWHGSSCTMATPELSFTTNGIQFADPTNVHIEEGRSVWIGYFKEYNSFQYIGCPKIDFFGLERRPVADLGECYSACSLSEYIAIVKNTDESTVTCFCFQADRLTTPYNTGWRSKKCAHRCGDAACNDELDNDDNGNGNGKHIAVYHRDLNNYGVSSVIEAQQSCPCHCLLMIPGVLINTFSWGKCSAPLLTMCNGHRFYENSTSIHYDSQPFRNWLDANDYCNSLDGYYPATTDATETADIPQSSSQLWTGVLRSLSIVGVTGITKDQSVGESYAYVTNESGQLKVTFTNDKQAMRYALCVEETSTKSQTITSPAKVSSSHSNSPETSTKSQTITSPVDVSYSHSISPETSPSLSTVRTTHVSTSVVPSGSTMNTTSSNHRSADDSGSSAAVAAGVSVAVIVVVGIVVVLIVLRKRGILFQPKKDNIRSEEGRNCPSISSPSYLSTTNTSVKDVNGKNTKCSSESPHNYFVLEKYDNDKNSYIEATDDNVMSTNDYNIYNKIDDGGDYADIDQANTTEGDYNIADAHIVKPVEHSKTGNVYNKVNINTGGDYDHIDGLVEPSKATGENDYDTTSAGNLNGSISTGTCDTTNTNHDSPYNHLNDTPLKRSQPDNAYGNPVLEDKNGGYGSTNSVEAGNSSYDKVNTKW